MNADLADRVVSKYHTIAINDTYKIAPFADVLYFCDKRWYEWHAEGVEAFRGKVVTLENYDLGSDKIKHLHNYGRDGLHLDPPDGVMTGRNSGYQAINLAILFGAKRILLHGYDMRWIDGKAHFHKGHPVETAADIYERCMLPQYKQLPPLLAKLGVTVVNMTPNSALTVFDAEPSV